MRVLVNISAHGFGHLAQIAPVARALKSMVPGLEVTARTALAADRLETAFGFTPATIPAFDDFGIPMHNAYAPDGAAALASWRNATAASDSATDALASFVRAGRFDCVLSAISPWPLLAARKASVPSFGIGSFAWTDILESLCNGAEGLDSVLEPMRRAYASADALFRLTPGLSMRGLKSVETQPLSGSGRPRQADLRRALNAESSAKLIVAAFGGMLPEQPPPLFQKPRPGWKVLGPSKWVGQYGAIDADALDLSFADVLASADLVISKPGYGIAVEIAAHGTPCILAPRADWPEDEPIMAWLNKRAPVRRAQSIAAIDANMVARALDDAEPLPLGTPVRRGDGGRDIAAAILAQLA